jgi:hypothetical protein
MNRSIYLAIAAACVSFSCVTVQAARLTQSDIAKQIKSISGTYTCKSGNMSHTSTFKSIYGGHGILISESGSNEQVLFDTRRQKWIDEHIDSDGGYSVMEGSPLKHGIDFTNVYPSGFNATLTVRMPVSGKMTTTFKGMMNGKMQTETETCTKR